MMNIDTIQFFYYKKAWMYMYMATYDWVLHLVRANIIKQ